MTLSVILSILTGHTCFLSTIIQNSVFSTGSYTNSYKTEEISSCHSSSSSSLCQLLPSSTLDCICFLLSQGHLIPFSFTQHKTSYFCLKWGSETEDHRRNSFTSLTQPTSDYKSLKFCLTFIY